MSEAKRKQIFGFLEKKTKNNLNYVFFKKHIQNPKLKLHGDTIVNKIFFSVEEVALVVAYVL